MIPQRDLSLLSNRLAERGGRRVPETVLERDYGLAWFLVGLSRSPLRDRLAFKGGTALKKCYFEDYRRRKPPGPGQCCGRANLGRARRSGVADVLGRSAGRRSPGRGWTGGAPLGLGSCVGAELREEGPLAGILLTLGESTALRSHTPLRLQRGGDRQVADGLHAREFPAQLRDLDRL